MTLNTKIYVGCTGFNYDSWHTLKGGFYPPKIKQTELLDYYVTKFATTEINSTYYNIPKKETVERWKKSLPKDFIITAKIPQIISLANNLAHTKEKLNEFLDVMAPLDKNIGPLVLQLSPSFENKFKKIEELEQFFNMFPLDKYQLVVELRHESWYTDELYALLNTYDVGMVSSFLPYLPFKIFEEVKKSIVYWRIIGSHDLDISLGKEIIDRNEETNNLLEKFEYTFKVKKPEVCYIYINNHFTGFAPPMTQNFIELLEKRNLPVVKPTKGTYKGQETLSSYFKM